MTNGRPGPELGEVVSIIGPDGATATVARHGGHVVSWRTADGLERLFVSDRATIAAGAAIRGGIPVCFPQFAGWVRSPSTASLAPPRGRPWVPRPWRWTSAPMPGRGGHIRAD